MDEYQPEMTKRPAQAERPARPVQGGQPGQKQAAKKSRKGAVAAIFTYCIVLLCLQAILIILYLFGIVTLFGESVDPLLLLDIILGLINFNNAATYYILTSFAFEIIYIILFVLMVRAFILSLKNCKYLKKKTPAFCRIALVDCSERLSEMFFLYTCVPIAIASMIGETHLSGAAVAMLVIIPLVQTVEYIVERLTVEKRPPVGEFLFELGKRAFLYAVFCMLVSFLRSPVFHDFIRGAVILFNGNITFGDGFFAFLHLFYIHIISPILYIFMLAFAYRVIAIALLDPPEIRKRRLKSAIKRAVIFTGVLLGLELVFGAFVASALNGMSIAIFGDWFLLVRQSHLPVFVLLVGCMLLNSLWGDNAVPATAPQPAATNAG